MVDAFEDPAHEEMVTKVQREDSRMWATADSTFWGTPETRKTLPSGVYRMMLSDRTGPTFVKQHNGTDQLIQLPDSASESVLDEIRHFSRLKPKFQEHGFLFKRGILLWGPPGSGKTCTIQLAMQMLIESQDAIVALVDHPLVATDCLQMLRRLEPDRMVVMLMEDIDALIDRFGETSYLALLDGESQIGDVITIATTNYPEKLDKRFADRPSRFDTLKFVGMPTPAARDHFLKVKLPGLSDGDRFDMVAASNGWSIAHLRELIVLTQCFEKPLHEAAARISALHTSSPNSTQNPDRPVFGFTSGMPK